MTTLLAILYRLGRWLRDHPGAALAIVGAGLVAWWRRRAKRAEAREHNQHHRADAAEAQVIADRETADRVIAGHRAEEEIDRAAPPNLDPAARRRALRDWVRRRLRARRPDRAP